MGKKCFSKSSLLGLGVLKGEAEFLDSKKNNGNALPKSSWEGSETVAT